jgi:single-strand DNA-binding protein
MYQSCTIVGNLGKDVELRYTPQGKAVASFSVAVNERKLNSDTGQWDESVTWFRATCWERRAETAAEYLRKGSKVLIVGPVKASAWTDKEGNARASLEITAREIKFLSGGSDKDSAENLTQGTQATQADEGIPF